MKQIDKAREKSEIIQNMYKSGLSVWKISDKIGVSGQTIHKHLSNIGFKLRSRSESIRTHSLKHDLFKEIDTHEKAYWLGMLFADGSMTFENGIHTISLTLHRDDRYHIETFKDFLGSSVNIYDRKDKLASSLVVAGKSFCEHLINKGMIPRKSLILSAPIGVPDNLFNSFVLGVFDGDGSISARKKSRYLTHQVAVRIVGAHDFMKFLSYKITEITGIPLRSIRKHHNSNIYAISYEGRFITSKLLAWMYKDSKIFLERKKNLYIKFSLENKTEENRILKLKTVVQKNIDGTVVREWESAVKASKELKIDISGIYNCAKGRIKTSAGYKWEYKY